MQISTKSKVSLKGSDNSIKEKEEEMYNLKTHFRACKKKKKQMNNLGSKDGFLL